MSTLLSIALFCTSAPDQNACRVRLAQCVRNKWDLTAKKEEESDYKRCQALKKYDCKKLRKEHKLSTVLSLTMWIGGSSMDSSFDAEQCYTADHGAGADTLRGLKK